MSSPINESHFTETYKSLITISIEGFKFCALINGGAAVALLAFLGNVAGKTPCVTVPNMRCPMGAFLLGLVCCGIAMIFSYVTQLRLLNETANRASASLSHNWYLKAAALFVALSLLGFAIGAWQAVVRFHS